MEELDIKNTDPMHGQYLTFKVGAGSYGIEIAYIIDIIAMLPITEVPEVPPYIKGIVNVRGKILPVMDVRIRFGMEPREYNDRTCIIFVTKNDVTIGIIVDMVEESSNIADEDIVPQIDLDSQHKFVKGVAKTPSGMKMMLDCDRLFYDEV